MNNEHASGKTYIYTYKRSMKKYILLIFPVFLASVLLGCTSTSISRQTSSPTATSPAIPGSTTSATTDVGMPTIFVAPSPVISGEPFTIKGYNFSHNATILPGGITCDDVTFSGTAQYDVNASGGFWLTIYQRALKESDITTTNVAFTPGTYTISVTDDKGTTASTTFTVVIPTTNTQTTATP
jgi:hypothetical protein